MILIVVKRSIARPNTEDRNKTTISLLSATGEQLKGLPPALIIVDENDILRDEGEDYYARKLLQAGVEITAGRVLATIHDFVMLNALADTAATKTAIELASQELVRVLGSVACRRAA